MSSWKSILYEPYFYTFDAVFMPVSILTTIIQTIDHYITYSVIASSPALTYSSVISTIRCYAVTSGENEGSTFVQWSAHFSSDADAGMYPSTASKTCFSLLTGCHRGH